MPLALYPPVDLSSCREGPAESLHVAADACVVAATGSNRSPALGYGRAAGSQGGAGAVVGSDGEPVVHLGGNLRSARPVAVGGNPIRLSARVRRQHLHIRAHAPFSAVPAEP